MNKKLIIVLIIILIFAICIYVIKFNIYSNVQDTENFEEILSYEDELQNTSEGSKISEEFIVVHIDGEVNIKGIIKIPANSRIADAIETAGGLTEYADISNVNLAYILQDGMKITIPNLNDSDIEKQEYITKDNGDNIVEYLNDNDSSDNSLVNINTANQTELETLPGIGPSIALKIINYRNENGKFKSIDDIKSVSGIGDSKFENIKNLICI